MTKRIVLSTNRGPHYSLCQEDGASESTGLWGPMGQGVTAWDERQQLQRSAQTFPGHTLRSKEALEVPDN